MRDHLCFGLSDDVVDFGGPVLLADVPQSWREEQLVLQSLRVWRLMVRHGVVVPYAFDLRSSPR